MQKRTKLGLDGWCNSHDPHYEAPDVDEQLRRQAHRQGVKGFEPTIEDDEIEQRRIEKKEEEEKALATFSGIRGKLSIEGILADGASFTRANEPHEPLDLMKLASVDELETLGADVLGTELSRLGMKKGGSVKQKAGRLWQTRGLKGDLSSLPKKLFTNKQGSSSLPTPLKRKQLERSVEEERARRGRQTRKQGGPRPPEKGPLAPWQSRKPDQKSLPALIPRSMLPGYKRQTKAGTPKADHLGPIF